MDLVYKIRITTAGYFTLFGMKVHAPTILVNRSAADLVLLKSHGWDYTIMSEDLPDPNDANKGNMSTDIYDADKDGYIDRVRWSAISGKPISAITDIDSAVSKAHIHNNKSSLDQIKIEEGKLYINDELFESSGKSEAIDFEIKSGYNGTMPGGTFVVLNDVGSVIPAVVDNPDVCPNVVGLTLHDVDKDVLVKIKNTGVIKFEGSNFELNKPVYIGLDGTPTQNIPDPEIVSYAIRVGVVIAVDEILLDIRTPILLKKE